MIQFLSPEYLCRQESYSRKALATYAVGEARGRRNRCSYYCICVAADRIAENLQRWLQSPVSQKSKRSVGPILGALLGADPLAAMKRDTMRPYIGADRTGVFNLLVQRIKFRLGQLVEDKALLRDPEVCWQAPCKDSELCRYKGDPTMCQARKLVDATHAPAGRPDSAWWSTGRACAERLMVPWVVVTQAYRVGSGPGDHVTILIADPVPRARYREAKVSLRKSLSGGTRLNMVFEEKWP